MTYKKPRSERIKIMRSIALMVGFALALITSAAAQKANIEAANAKWMQFWLRLTREPQCSVCKISVSFNV